MAKNRLSRIWKGKPTFTIILAIISILGFLTNALELSFGIGFGKTVVIVSTILIGIALLTESNLRKVFQGRKVNNSELVRSLVVGFVGIIVIVSGTILATYTLLNLELSQSMANSIALVQTFSAVLIFVEAFLVR